MTDKDEVELTEEALWTSSDPDVVEVTEDGELIAREPGKAVVTARYSLKKVTVNVLVTEEEEPQNITTSPSYLRLDVDETEEVMPTTAIASGR